MASVAVRCPQCGSNEVIKRGKTDTGSQRYQCRNNVCGQGSFLLEYRYQGYLPRVKRQIVDMALMAAAFGIQPECWVSARTQ
jgi:transposase-like protein